MRGRTAGALSLAAAMLLQGCVAAVIPAIAASGIVKSQMGKKRSERATPAAQIALTQNDVAILPIMASRPLPRTSDPTLRFVNYALMAAATGATPSHSMVLSPASRIEKVDFLPCEAGQPLAVAIDAGLASAPKLKEALRRLRAFSVEVLWIADANEVDPLRKALTKSGAWAHGDAPILTTGVGAESKELVRQEATRAFCVVAVAGARRGSVEEMYNFLRDPMAATWLEPYWDAGWFILPAGNPGN